MKFFIFRFDSVFELDLETFRNVEFSNLFVCLSGEWIVDLISVENFIHLLLSIQVCLLSCLDGIAWFLIIAVSKYLHCETLLLKTLRICRLTL